MDTYVLLLSVALAQLRAIRFILAQANDDDYIELIACIDAAIERASFDYESATMESC